MNEETDAQEEVQAAAVLSGLERMRNSPCRDCRTLICGHEALMSLVMGFQDAPLCWCCLSAVLEHGKEELRDHLFACILHRPCHHAGWLWANREEGFEPGALPVCLWPSACAASGDPRRGNRRLALVNDPGRNADTHHVEWDAGGMACGDLVLQLRIRLGSLQPGQVLKVTASDPGAREDIPAWCRLTGHALRISNHPMYLIERKEG